MFDPIKDRLIRDAGRHETVMLNLPVDLVALLTHDTRLKATAGSNRPPAIMTAAGLFCFNRITAVTLLLVSEPCSREAAN
jgi:hypothetical protein